MRSKRAAEQRRPNKPFRKHFAASGLRYTELNGIDISVAGPNQREIVCRKHGSSRDPARSTRKDISRDDAKRLAAEGFQQFTVEWTPDGGVSRRAAVFARARPGDPEVFRARDELFGGSGGTMRFFVPDGTRFCVNLATPNN